MPANVHGSCFSRDPGGLNCQPFNEQTPDGPLELCVCASCGTPIMLDDKQKRIRVIVPNLMGYDASELFCYCPARHSMMCFDM